MMNGYGLGMGFGWLLMTTGLVVAVLVIAAWLNCLRR